MDNIIKDSEDNASGDAEATAKFTEVQAEALEGRLLAEQYETEVAFQALRFLAEKEATKSASGEKSAKSASGEKPAKSASGEKPAKSASGEKPAKSASGEKPAKSASGEKKLPNGKAKKTSDKRSDADITAGKKKGRGKDQRKDDVEAAATKNKELNQNKTAKYKKTQTDLKKEQSKCFKQVFKFASGMMCLACDANYADIVSLVDGKVQVKVQKKSCTNLKSNCYGYMKAREDAGSEAKEVVTAKKVRK